MARLRLLFLPLALQQFAQHIERAKHGHHDRQKEWNVYGVFLLVRKVKLCQQAGVKEAALRGHKGALGQRRGIQQTMLQQCGLGSQDVIIRIGYGGAHMIVNHNVADLICKTKRDTQ